MSQQAVLDKTRTAHERTPLQYLFNGEFEGLDRRDTVASLKVPNPGYGPDAPPSPIWVDECMDAVSKLNISADDRIERAQIAHAIVLLLVYGDLYNRRQKFYSAQSYVWDENMSDLFLALLTGWFQAEGASMEFYPARTIDETYTKPSTYPSQAKKLVKEYTFAQIALISAMSHLATFFDLRYESEVFLPLKRFASANMPTTAIGKVTVEQVGKTVPKALNLTQLIVENSIGFYKPVKLWFEENVTTAKPIVKDMMGEALGNDFWLKYFDYLTTIVAYGQLSTLTNTTRSSMHLPGSAAGVYFLANLATHGNSKDEFFKPNTTWMNEPVRILAHEVFDNG